MPRSVKKRSHKTGLTPGSAVYVGEKKAEKIRITVVDYDEHAVEMKDVDSINDCLAYREKPSTSWINIDGLHETEIIQELGNGFGLHSLTVEDILNTEQRPKVEMFDDYIFIVIKMIYHHDGSDQIDAEQVSLVLGRDYVLTFQEREGDIFDPVRNRIRNNKGKIRRVKADYLAYALMDAIVDTYFGVLEKTGEQIEAMEDELITTPTPATLQKIHVLKRESIYMRKSVWPLRDIISGLSREESDLIMESTGVYIRDLYDHTIQVIDSIETFRDMIGGMLDIYLSSVSNRMNEIMKVLTIFAALFIPLTFIAGIYGMNFNTEKSPFNMPELGWYFGYPFALGIMIIVGGAMLYYFKRKNWL